MLQRIQEAIKQSAIHTLPGIVNQFIAVLLFPIYTRVFVPADHGIMSGVSLIVPIVTGLLMFGVESGVACYDLGLRGRDYAEKYHDSPKVAIQLAELYENL